MSDNDDIPFNRNFPLKAGVVEEVRPGVRRVLCNNPSPFTFTGTVSYIVGHRQRRDHRSRPGRRGACGGAARCRARRDGEPYLRHPHPSRPFAEHARGSSRRPARPSMPRARTVPRARASRARSTIRNPAPTAISRPISGSPTATSSRAPAGVWRPWRRPATPPTISPSPGPNGSSTFVGDHVMGWSTSIVAPPDGSMIDYMESLDRLAAREERSVFLRPRPGDPGRPALRALPDPPPQGARGLDPASPGQGRGRHPDHGARDLYRHRSAG